MVQTIIPWYNHCMHRLYYGTAISWYTMLESWVAYSVVNLTLINAIQIFQMVAHRIRPHQTNVTCKTNYGTTPYRAACNADAV